MQMLYIFGTTYRSHIVTTIVIKRPKKVLKCTKIIIKYESDKKKISNVSSSALMFEIEKKSCNDVQIRYSKQNP